MSYIDDLDIKDAGNGIKFFESKAKDIHYYMDPKGRQVAGVTSAIGEMIDAKGGIFKYNTETNSLIDKVILGKAADRGSRIHKGLEFYIQSKNGNLKDFDTFEDAVKSIGLQGAGEEESAMRSIIDGVFESKHFQDTFDLSKSLAETSVYSPTHDFAGTIDLLAKNRKTNEYHVLDFKLGREVPMGVGPQTAAGRLAARERFKDIKDFVIANTRGVIHSEKTSSGRHSPRWYMEGDKSLHSQKYFTSKDEEKFLGHLRHFQSNGLKYNDLGENSVADIIEQNTAKVIDNIVNNRRGRGDFKTTYIDHGKNHGEIYDRYSAAADKMGWQMVESRLDGDRRIGGISQSGEGWNYTFVKKKSQTTGEELSLLTRRLRESRAAEARINPERSLRDLINEAKDIGSVRVGDTLRGTGDALRDSGRAKLVAAMSPISLKSMGVGAAAGYAAGAIYGALKNNEDPTSTYEEDRNILGNALKGTVIGLTAGAVVGTHLGADSVRMSEDFIGQIGSSARGMCKGADKMWQVFKAAGALRR